MTNLDDTQQFSTKDIQEATRPDSNSTVQLTALIVLLLIAVSLIGGTVVTILALTGKI